MLIQHPKIQEWYATNAIQYPHRQRKTTCILRTIEKYNLRQCSQGHKNRTNRAEPVDERFFLFFRYMKVVTTIWHILFFNLKHYRIIFRCFLSLIECQRLQKKQIRYNPPVAGWYTGRDSGLRPSSLRYAEPSFTTLTLWVQIPTR